MVDQLPYLMKKIISFIIIFLTILPANAAFAAKQPVFNVQIKQNGRLKKIKNHAVELQRKPFELVITFKKQREPYVMLNTSFSETLYAAARAGEDSVKFQVFEEGRGLAEGLFNVEKELIANDEASQFLHYNNKKDHRFNDVKLLKNGSIVGRRKVDFITKLTYTETENIFEKIPLSELEEETVYLVFLNQKWNRDFTKATELKRDFIKITFLP